MMMNHTFHVPKGGCHSPPPDMSPRGTCTFVIHARPLASVHPIWNMTGASDDILRVPLHPISHPTCQLRQATVWRALLLECGSQLSTMWASDVGEFCSSCGYASDVTAVPHQYAMTCIFEVTRQYIAPCHWTWLVLCSMDENAGTASNSANGGSFRQSDSGSPPA